MTHCDLYEFILKIINKVIFHWERKIQTKVIDLLRRSIGLQINPTTFIVKLKRQSNVVGNGFLVQPLGENGAALKRGTF